MKKAIVLINPNNRGNYVQGTFNRENLSLGYLDAYISSKGFHVKVIDARAENLSVQDTVNIIAEIKPFLVGFSVIAKDAIPWCQEVGQLIVNVGKPHICLGGYFPTMQPERALNSMSIADSIILGEGEVTFSLLAERIYNHREWRGLKGIAFRKGLNIMINQRRRLIKNLNDLPIPRHYAAALGLSEYALEGSRGCFCSCSFCSISPFVSAKKIKDKWRCRSSSSIISEIRYLLSINRNISIFRFVDPDFVGAVSEVGRLKRFISMLRKEGLRIKIIIDTRSEVVNGISEEVWKRFRDVGLAEVYLGIESTSQEIKKKMLKRSTIDEDVTAIEKLERIGVRVRYGFMMLTPWSKEEDIRANAIFLRDHGFSRLDKYFQEMYLVPGTGAIHLLKGENVWFDRDGEGEYYTYELKRPLRKLRELIRICIQDHQIFLERVQDLHERTRRIEVSGINVEQLKRDICCLNYEIFMTIFDNSQKHRFNMRDDLNNILGCFAQKIFNISENIKIYE